MLPWKRWMGQTQLNQALLSEWYRNSVPHLSEFHLGEVFLFVGTLCSSQMEQSHFHGHMHTHTRPKYRMKLHVNSTVKRYKCSCTCTCTKITYFHRSINWKGCTETLSTWSLETNTDAHTVSRKLALQIDLHFTDCLQNDKISNCEYDEGVYLLYHVFLSSKCQQPIILCKQMQQYYHNMTLLQLCTPRQAYMCMYMYFMQWS